jgi:Tol biopolymer transport system component
MNKMLRVWAVAVVVCLVYLGVPAAASIFEVTSVPAGGFNSSATITGDGRYVVFVSNFNLGGLNPVPIPNIFRYDLLTNQFIRVTAEGGSDPVVSADGRYIAFSSSASYTKRNEDGSDEIFRYSVARKRFQQLTSDKEGEGGSVLPAISGDSKRVAFETTSNLRRRNADFSNEVFLFNRSGNGALSVDPEGEGESHTPSLSGDGKLIAFVSTSNLTGRNDDFSQELFLYDLDKHTLSQATSDPEGNGESSVPAVSRDGGFVVFVSSSNVAGLNPDNASAIYLRSRSGRYTLISATPDGPFDGEAPTINEDGRWIAFMSSYDITGGNPDHSSEILLYNRTRKTFSQLTDQPLGCSNLGPKQSSNGARVAFMSTCDYTGGNPDHNMEVFVVDNPALNLQVHAEGPVDLLITDPNGLVVSKTTKTIPNASYVQGDFDGDLIGEVRVTVPQAAEGRYLVQVVAAAGSHPSDPVDIDGAVNGANVVLASGTVADLGGTVLGFGNQSFSRTSSRMTPLAGIGSRLSLSMRLNHPKATSGEVKVGFNDGNGEQLFDFGRVENFGHYGSIKGIFDGFYVKMRVVHRSDSTQSINLSAKDGDLSEFAGTDNLNMTITVQVGPDTDVYNWRFKRNLTTGKLVMK